LMVATGLFSSAALSTYRGIKRSGVFVLSGLIALNPVSVAQMYSYYVDGQLASLFSIAVCLLVLIYRRFECVLILALLMVIILIVNVKLNGALYIAILSGGYWLWYAMVKKERRIVLALWIIFSGVVGSILVGFDPYITQYVSKLFQTGNPFYPTDWQGLTGVVSNYPVDFTTMNRWHKLFIALFSQSDNSKLAAKLKIPFTLSLNELFIFNTPDVRIGGFGPLFGGSLILAIAVLIMLVWKYRKRLLLAGSVLVLAGLIVISSVSNSEMWWARYTPQLWLIPILVSALGLWLVRRHDRSRWLIYSLIVTLFINSMLIISVNTIGTVGNSISVSQQLHELKSRPYPLPIQLNGFVGTGHRLDIAGIRYIEVNPLVCSPGKQVKIVSSQAYFCSDSSIRD
jgi:hypothetical protein